MPAVDKRAATDLSVATAEGKGSGRFFALALLDALDGGGAFTGVRFHSGSSRGRCDIDFVVFHPFNARGEVVRARLDSAGNVVAAELLRTVRESFRRYRHQDALAEALRAGQAVAAIHLEPHAGGESRMLAIHFAAGEPMLVDLGEFDSVSAGC